LKKATNAEELSMCGASINARDVNCTGITLAHNSEISSH